MSRARYFGGPLDAALSSGSRSPAYKVLLWNPNRTTIQDVVLGRAASPAYDVTPWVESLQLTENASFENQENASAPSCTLRLARDEASGPIPISERTILDNAPVRVLQGDLRVPEEHWATVFTGVVRGGPTFDLVDRDPSRPKVVTAVAVGREEAYLNSRITARSYERGTDVGKVAVEAAIEFMGLDRREVRIGLQGFSIGHTQAQLVDLDALKGLYEVLFTVGKKPRFDAEGFLVAADTDLSKPPARSYPDDSVVSIRRIQGGASMFNSVRLLGLSNVVTEVVEQEKRLAHGSLTAGFFERNVEQHVAFSEPDSKETGARRAMNTRLWKHIGTMGVKFGGHCDWVPDLEDDGYTCFGGTIKFDTGFAPMLKEMELAGWVSGMLLELIGETTQPIPAQAEIILGKGMQITAMVTLLITLMEIGRMDWEIWGQPFNRVFQQLCSTATLKGIGAAEIREVEYRNDWLYDIAHTDARARELLRRELVKGHAYDLEVLDDPLVEVDDVVEAAGMRFYLTSISRVADRVAAPRGTMTATGWRVA